MFRAALLLVFVTIAGGAYARDPASASDLPSLYRAQDFAGLHGVGPGDSALAGPALHMARGPSSPLPGPTGAPRSRPEGIARTALDYSLAPGGVFGSVGFICLSDDAPIAAHEVALFSGSQDGRLLGGTIRYPLK